MVEVSSGGEKHSAILRDISRTGAKLGGISPLAEGQEVELKSGEMRVMGQVVWIEGGDCAIAFDFPIAAVEVSRLQSLAKFVEGVSDKKL